MEERERERRRESENKEKRKGKKGMPQWGKKIDSPTWGGAGLGRGSQMESLGTQLFPSLTHSFGESYRLVCYCVKTASSYANGVTLSCQLSIEKRRRRANTTVLQSIQLSLSQKMYHVILVGVVLFLHQLHSRGS